MSSHLAAIEVMKLPWIALLFMLAHWKTAVAAVWGVGFTVILVKRMCEWYREDGRDAAVGASSEGAIFSNMKLLSRDRRGARLKGLMTNGLFWILYLAHATGKRIAKWAFYPILVVLDKAQTKGIEEGKIPGLKHLPVIVTDDTDGLPSPEPTVLIEGENASKCVSCKMVVARSSRPHVCESLGEVHLEGLRIVPPVAVRSMPKKKSMKCDDCSKMIIEDSSHKCLSRACVDDDSVVHCECGTVYVQTDDFEHVCPEEDEKDLQAECKDCEIEYDPSVDVHVARFCKGCDEVHCKKQDCGHVVA
jgi:hypothetical protein